MSPLRIGVIGAGPMGRLHARAIARRADREGDCRLAWVHDRHEARAMRVAEEFSSRVARGLTDLSATADAVVVAVPTPAHSEVTEVALAQGAHVLLEKPMTGSIERARELAELASSGSRVLAVGHVEWFSPHWRAAIEAAGTVRHIEVDRLGPPSDRGLEIDVIQDLMLHDLDWIRRTLGGEPHVIEATGVSLSDFGLDEAHVVLRFDQGIEASLRASRVFTKRDRRVRVEGALGTFEVDLINGCFTNGQPTQSESALEPLDHLWSDFVRACRGEGVLENDIETGLATLDLVERVRVAIDPLPNQEPPRKKSTDQHSPNSEQSNNLRVSKAS